MRTMKDLRESQNLTQVKVAETLGVTERAYQYWEHGDVSIPTGRLVPLSRVLDVEISELLEAWANMGFIDAEEFE